MMSEKILDLLQAITLKDCQYNPSCVQTIAHAGELGQQVFIYSDQTNYYFQAIGSPYLLAMTKWLVMQLQDKDKAALATFADIDIAKLQQMFDLPTHKRQDALVILQLIEQL
ncbi:hypothetical protein GCM10010995_12720 [Cysteiniphilum litorale]|uniref:Uncharacterized protein n=2 Tax=Cysteiniphilum litorale TaxID=2056700 RepID=A0A8J3E8P0_9GAMM|nr:MULTISPECIES: hypothetical protein [Cysteiniphilum]GGF96893.1 hypothetical protein GCM10010995_12720 [Cysteiniphilum litorale]